MKRGSRLEEHVKLQEAAAATVASLKKLLQEKNATIERMQSRLDEVRNTVLRVSVLCVTVPALRLSADD